MQCGVGFTCCYLMTKASVGDTPQGNCPLPCKGWDSWAEAGIKKGALAPGGARTKTEGYVPNFGKWRDPAIASKVR
jgi:hypothetical protein